jgi:hypothetical protein
MHQPTASSLYFGRKTGDKDGGMETPNSMAVAFLMPKGKPPTTRTGEADTEMTQRSRA